MKEIQIRTASPADAPALLQIYAPYVEKTAITFEYTVPTLAEFQQRMENTLGKYPYLVAEQGDEILGYAYLGAFHPRAAYDWAAETSIYLQENQRHQGLGKRLYTALEQIAKAQHLCNLYACIGYPEKEDCHLTKNSVAFHQHLGYELIGHFHHCGYKFDTWYDMVWMEKIIGSHLPDMPPVIPFPQLKRETGQSLGITL